MSSSRKVGHDKLTIEILKQQDDLSAFDCSNQDINDFIHNEAKEFQNERLGTSYIFSYCGTPIAFVTLSMADLKRDKMESKDRLQIDVENYPALQIGQLAVCRKFERQNIGTFLCDFSLAKAYKFSEEVGCGFLVLNAKRDAIPFYDKYGFKLLPKQGKRDQPVMFLNIFNKEQIKFP